MPDKKKPVFHAHLMLLTPIVASIRNTLLHELVTIFLKKAVKPFLFAVSL
jgi:hypothetical protein